MNALRVAWTFFRVGAMNEMQYRINFIVELFQSSVQLGTGLVALWIIFSKTATLGGWSVDELLVVMGVFTLMGGLIQAFIQPNMERLIGEIRDGTFDYALTKPEDAQLIVSVRELRLWQATDVLVGVMVLVIAVTHLQSRVGVLQALAFVVVLLMGAMMIYSFWLMLTTASFWIIRMDEIVNLFQGVYAAGRYPIGIYPGWLRFALTFLVPIAFAVTVPAETVTGRLSLGTFAGTCGLTLCLLIMSRMLWRAGLRRYAGASA